MPINNKETNIRKIKKEDILRTSQTYAEVFAGKPWYEISKCSSCGQFGSNQPEEGIKCTNCSSGTLSLPAYPEDSTSSYIKKELMKINAIGLLAIYLNLTNTQQVGFGWGYQLDGDTFANEKYSSEEMISTISELLISAGVFYYISEVGVIEPFQGNGIGKKLTNKLIDYGQSSQGKVLLRTNEDSSMRYIAEQSGMLPIVGLNSGVKDTENEERVIFVSKK